MNECQPSHIVMRQDCEKGRLEEGATPSKILAIDSSFPWTLSLESLSIRISPTATYSFFFWEFLA